MRRGWPIAPTWRTRPASVSGPHSDFLDLRDELSAEGVNFCSDTDTEVIVQLVERHLTTGLDLTEAARRTFREIHGAHGYLVSQFASAEHVRRFQEEARAAAALRHPNIVPIHEVGQCHGQHYFTMEYIEGPSLLQALDTEAPFTWPRAHRLGMQLIEATQAVHKRQGLIPGVKEA